MSWEQLFFDPIELPDGRVLRSLRDAGEFIQSLPKVTQDRPEWQVAVRALLLVVECGGDPMLGAHRHHAGLDAGKSAEPRSASQPPLHWRGSFTRLNDAVVIFSRRSLIGRHACPSLSVRAS